MRARSTWNELAKNFTHPLLQFSAPAQFKARAITGRIDCSRWRLTKIRDFYQFSPAVGRHLGRKCEKPGVGGFGSGTRQSHFRNRIYEVLSS